MVKRNKKKQLAKAVEKAEKKLKRAERAKYKETVFYKIETSRFYLTIDRLFNTVCNRVEGVRAFRDSVGFRAIFYVTLFLLGFVFSTLLGFGLLFTIIAALLAMYFFGLKEKRAGEASAYSVFNEGHQKIAGTFDAQDYERALRGGAH